jgi:hypothetical protein
MPLPDTPKVPVLCPSSPRFEAPATNRALFWSDSGANSV